MIPTPGTAFVMSGGASLGSIQAGMLQALYERGIAPDVVVGTSVGAINGAFIASRPQVRETAEELAGVWRGLRPQEVFPFNPLTALLGVAGRNFVVPNGPLTRLIKARLEFERLEDTAIPLHLIAVDLFTGRERRLSPPRVRCRASRTARATDFSHADELISAGYERACAELDRHLVIATRDAAAA